MKRWGVVAAACFLCLAQMGGISHAGALSATGAAVSGGAVGAVGDSGNRPDIICIFPIPGPFIYHVEKSDSFQKVTLNWRCTADSTYEIYRRTGTGKQSERLAAVQGGSYVDRTVKPGKEYVYSIWRADRSVPSLSSTVWVSLKPEKTKGVKAWGIRRGLTLQWKKAKNVTGYRIQLKPAGAGKKKQRCIVKDTKKNTYCRRKLGRGQKYEISIRAYKKVNGKKIYGPSVTKIRVTK